MVILKWGWLLKTLLFLSFDDRMNVESRSKPFELPTAVKGLLLKGTINAAISKHVGVRKECMLSNYFAKYTHCEESLK